MNEILTKINETLAKPNGVVQVTTYLRSTLYKSKHAGMFFLTKDGNLAVKQGKGAVRLSCAGVLGVSVQIGQVA